ncbi:preprotein translocase subunit YajC [Phytomonospora sp. NPDC050363]|uniref:preprotein translocase subunit YajC n=1 Tax=Phytomonospora sp. NPDC050363 TaxID=3155642 RepID=UPI0033DC842A
MLQAAGESGGGNNFILIGLLALMFVAMYFFMIRPQKKRQREQQEMQQGAGPGSRIVTIGGLHGTIVSVDDDTVTLDISDGVQVVFARQAIGRVLPTETAGDAADEVEESAVVDEPADEVTADTAAHPDEAPKKN